MGWFFTDPSEDFEYPEEYMDFLKQNGLKPSNEKRIDSMGKICFVLWKEIQLAKRVSSQ